MVDILVNPGNGGRGRKAPYETTHYRIPSPLKPAIETIASKYRDLIAGYQSADNPDLINAALHNTIEVDKKAIILKALEEFIKAQEKAYKPNGSQKAFSLDTRKWDALREFKKFVEGT